MRDTGSRGKPMGSKNRVGRVVWFSVLMVLVLVAMGIFLGIGLHRPGSGTTLWPTASAVVIILISVAYNLFYGAMVEGRFSSLAIAVLLTAWVQGTTEIGRASCRERV